MFIVVLLLACIPVVFFHPPLFPHFSLIVLSINSLQFFLSFALVLHSSHTIQVSLNAIVPFSLHFLGICSILPFLISRSFHMTKCQLDDYGEVTRQ